MDSLWRAGVDEALTSAGLDCLGPEESPKEAIQRLLAWHEEMVLDPVISERARALSQPPTDEVIGLRHKLHKKEAALNFIAAHDNSEWPTRCRENVATARRATTEWTQPAEPEPGIRPTLPNEEKKRCATIVHHVMQGWYSPNNGDALYRDLLALVKQAKAAQADAQTVAPTAHKPLTAAQRLRLYNNSPEIHADAASYAAFARIVALVEAAHSITQEGDRPCRS